MPSPTYVMPTCARRRPACRATFPPAIFTIEDVCTWYIHDMTHQMLDAATELARIGSLQIGRPE